MTSPAVTVLTYHSISKAAGPTAISPAVFAMQMRALSDEGIRALSLDEFLDWRAGRLEAPRAALITFDDAFTDFYDEALPVLRRHGFPSVVFVPSRLVGGYDSWEPNNRAPRPLMSWDQLKRASDLGVVFGSHSRSHRVLTALSPQARHEEIECSADDLAEQLGARPRAFAAPYGAVDRQVIDEIAECYDAAFGVRLAQTTRSDKGHDLPRVDMHYFRNERRWRGLLKGETTYLRARQGLRRLRGVLAGSPDGSV